MEVYEDEERDSDHVEDPGKPMAVCEIPKGYAALDRADDTQYPVPRRQNLYMYLYARNRGTSVARRLLSPQGRPGISAPTTGTYPRGLM